MDSIEQEYSKSNLYMPSNISAEKEIIAGIYKKELKYLAILIGISFFIGFTISIFTNFKLGGIVCIFLITCSYFLVVRDGNNYSTITQILGIYRYLKRPNIYNYKYTEWWEKYLNETKKEKRNK